MLAYSIRCNLEDLENRKADIEAEIKMVQLRHEIEAAIRKARGEG